MKSTNTSKLTVLGICIPILLLTGCNSNRVSLTKEGIVSVVKQPSEKVDILWTDVYQQDGNTWLYSVLKQKGLGPGTIKTHVDIQMLAKNGSVLYETTVENIYVPRNRVGKGLDWKQFRVRLPNTSMEGAMVKLTIHS